MEQFQFLQDKVNDLSSMSEKYLLITDQNVTSPLTAVVTIVFLPMLLSIAGRDPDFRKSTGGLLTHRMSKRKTWSHEH